MPLHDLRCRACGSEFEALVRPTDPPRVCPECGGDQLERLLSLFAVSTQEQTRRAVESSRRHARKAHRDKIEYQKEIEEHHHH